MNRRLQSLIAWLSNSKNWKRVILPLLVIGGLFVLGRLLEIDRYLQSAQQWIWSLGPWGPVVYGSIYVVATLLLMPGTPFTIVAALLFGPLWGFVTMTAATTAVAVIAFLGARYFARALVERHLCGTPAFRKLKSIVEKNSWFAIPAIRFLPFFPFAFNNYALGLTRIGFWPYLLLSELVFIPMNAVFVLGANALYRAMIRGETSWTLIGVTTAAGLLVLALGYAAKRMFNTPEDEEPPSSDSDTFG